MTIFVTKSGSRLLEYDIKRDLKRDNESRSKYRDPERCEGPKSVWIMDEAGARLLETAPLVLDKFYWNPM